jgi:hypothetical protein
MWQNVFFCVQLCSNCVHKIKNEGLNMQVKTENHKICICMTRKEASILQDEIESLDTPNNGLLCLDVLKDVILAGIYIDK